MSAMRFLVLLALGYMCGCTQHEDAALQVPAGDARRGRTALAELECGVCHVIPGIPGAYGHVGPPLDDYRRNVYIAGKYPNVPEILVDFIRDAPSLAPETAMPKIDMSDAQARDIAAYLYAPQ